MSETWMSLWLFVLSVGSAALSWYLRTMREDLRELERCVHRLSKTGAAEDIRGDYADKRLSRIEEKLDLLLTELAKKVDRRDCLAIHSHKLADG